MHPNSVEGEKKGKTKDILLGKTTGTKKNPVRKFEVSKEIQFFSF